MDHFTSYNPRTGAPIGTYPITGEDEVFCAVDRARMLAGAWAARSPEERASVLRQVRDSIVADEVNLTQTVCEEIGKPPQDAVGADMLALILGLDWLIANGPGLLNPHRIRGERHARLEAVPYGVVGVIGTWNYPLLLDGACVASALLAGNAVVWKPSELAPACASALYKHFERAGLPVLLLPGDGTTGQALCQADIDKLAFTGGVPTGRAILARLALRGIPSVMELSGNDALIVCADADIEAAARAAVWARICNAGQSCVSPQRLYVVQSAYVDFVAACERILSGLHPGVDYGPLRTNGLRGRVHSLVNEAVGQGASLQSGGHCLADAEFADGFYYAPTLLTNVDNAMPIMRQDFFGPVLCVQSVPDDNAAIALANDCDMGLGASVWTRDASKGRAIASRLKAGVVTVNMETLMTGARPALPFGGMGASGWGRQRGASGLDEFAQWRTVCWQSAPGAQRHVFPYREATLPLLRGVLAFRAARGPGAKMQALRQLVSAARNWDK